MTILERAHEGRSTRGVKADTGDWVRLWAGNIRFRDALDEKPAAWRLSFTRSFFFHLINIKGGVLSRD